MRMGKTKYQTDLQEISYFQVRYKSILSKKMNLDELKQKMYAQGLDQKYFVSKECPSCPNCKQMTSVKFMPALLSCGHIICQQCTLDKPLQCFICKGKNVNVKLENFQTFRDYLQAVNRPTNGGSIYNFSISLLSVSITKILAGQSGERIVQEILNTHSDFGDYLKIHGKSTQIRINGKSFFYNSIKGLTLNQLQEQKNVRLVVYRQGSFARTNSITFSDRQMGGKF